MGLRLALALLLALVSWAPHVEATAVNASSLGSTGGSATGLDFLHSVSGSNTALVVSVTQVDTGSVIGVAGVTYAGSALTSLPNCTTALPGFAGTFTTFWYKINPASGSNHVVVTLNGTSYKPVAHAVSFTSALQTATASDFGCVTASGTSTAPSVSISSAIGEIVMDTLNSGVESAPTIGANQTDRGSFLSAGEFASDASTEPGASSVTMSWTLATSTIWSMAAVRIKSVGPPDTIPPTAPTNLSCNATSSSIIACTFTASTDNVGVTSYAVERSTTGCAGTFSALSTITTTTFTDTALSAATAYCYRVTATDGTNTSPLSNTSTATTLALRTVRIAYTDNASDETGFTCRRCEGNACIPIADSLTAGANVTTIDDTLSPQPIAGYKCRATKTGAVDSAETNVWYTPASTPAILGVSPPTLTFATTVAGPIPATQTVNITNSGPNSMNWTVSDNANWLSVTPASGSNNGALTVSVNHTTCTTDCPLAAGTFFATITVAAPGATNSPGTVLVQFNISPAATPSSGRSGRIR